MTHAGRVAVISDVHGNAVALAAVLAEVEREGADLLVFGGDLTWGPLPAETLELVRPYADRAIFIRGNAERMLLELAVGEVEASTDRDRWMAQQHDADALALLGGFVEAAVVDVDGLGRVRFCHGSPRSDEELVTPETPEERMRALLDRVEEQVLVTAHTHLQFDRHVAGIRSVNAGSVGMPYQGERGAFWALLGPDVDLRRTPYDVELAVERYRESGDPAVEEMVEILTAPPTPVEVIEHAERLEFSG